MNLLKRKLRLLAWWMLQHIHPAQDEIDIVVQRVWAKAGLPADAYHEDYELPPHKFTDLLTLSARELGNPLRTVGQLKSLLR